MRAYEIQLFKENKWEFDSYINDHGTAVVEAERLLNSNRHEGVRVIEEQYDPENNRSDCSVIYSKKRKLSRINRGKRSLVEGKKATRSKRAKPARKRRTASAKKATGKRPKRRTGRPRKSSGMGPVPLIVIAMVIVVTGIAALIGLQEMADKL